MQLLHDCRGFRNLAADRRRLVVEAAALTGLVWLGLRIVSFATLRRMLDAYGRRVLRDSQTASMAIGWAVSAVGQRFPGRTCLVEALTADVMLRRRQHNSVLHLGVRKTEDRFRPLDGHAWIESDGLVIVGAVANLAEYVEGAWTAVPAHSPSAQRT